MASTEPASNKKVSQPMYTWRSLQGEVEAPNAFKSARPPQRVLKAASASPRRRETIYIMVDCRTDSLGSATTWEALDEPRSGIEMRPGCVGVPYGD